MGIPNVIRDGYRVARSALTEGRFDALDRLELVMNGDIPQVFINQMGVADPDVDRVAGEYCRQLAH